MKTDTEIRNEGFAILFKYMDLVEAERFVSLIQRERFDYTKWRQHLFEVAWELLLIYLLSEC